MKTVSSSHPLIFSSSILLLCLLIMTAGCATLKTAPAGPVLPPPPDIIEKISRAGLQNRILTGTVHLTIESAEGFFSKKGAIAVQYPSSLRLETLSPLGPPDLHLVLCGNILKVFLPGEGKFYISRSAETSLPRFIPLRLGIGEVIPLLAGMPPPGMLKNRTLLGAEKEDLLYRIDSFSDEKKRRRSLWLEPGRMELARFESLGTDGDVLGTVILKNYRRVGGIDVPDRVEIRSEGEEGAGASVIRIRYSDLELASGEENKGLFDLEIPSGIKPHLLD